MTRKANIHDWWQYICHSRSNVGVHAALNLRCSNTTQSLRKCSNIRRLELRNFGQLHRVPGYSSSKPGNVDDNKRIPRPPSYAGRAPQTKHEENVVLSSENVEQKSMARKPLVEEGVDRLDPAVISRLYDQLLKNAYAGKTEEVSDIVKMLVTKNREKPNMKLYNALVLVNVSRPTGSAAAVAAILKEMEEEEILPDINVYHNVLKALAVHPDCILRASILAEMRRRWFTLTESGWHDVIAGYTREGLVEQALENLDSMQKAGIRAQGWLYDMIIYTLCDMNEIDEALLIMKDRVTNGENTIAFGSWYYLFDVACMDLHYDTLRFIWRRRVEQQQLNPTSGQCLQVLIAAARHGDIQVATDVFRILSKRATTFESQHYELLIEAYIQANDLKTALTILCIMNGANLPPTQSATSSILRYLKQSPSRPREAFDILNDLKSTRQVPTEAMNRIIEACVQHNGLHQAIEMYGSLRSICPSGPNVATFNSLFVGCRNESRKDTAMFLVSEMLEMKIRPNAVTYDRLILICLFEKDYEDAFRYYEEMRNAGMVPRPGTMVAMIKRCSENRDERAVKLVRAMEELGLDDPTSRNLLETIPAMQQDLSRWSFRKEAMAGNP